MRQSVHGRKQGARMGMEKKPMLIEIHSLLKYICNKLGNLRERDFYNPINFVQLCPV